MEALTPVQLRAGRWYKRDDLHLGSGGTNGAKLRACQFLVSRERDRGAHTIVTAASVLSPQHAIVANVCRELGMESHHIVGATNDTGLLRHPSTRSALEAGATFHHIGCAYNASLQPAAERLAATLPDAAVLHYGITTPASASPSSVRRFAEVGGRQVANLPDCVTSLVVPFGSGNSASGVLTGLDMYDRRDVAVKLVGIGPPRLEWLFSRMERIGVRLGDDITHYDLHSSGFARYSDKMPETRDGIVFHPTYEGKVVRFLDNLAPTWWTARDGTTCMWVVGSPVK